MLAINNSTLKLILFKSINRLLLKIFLIISVCVKTVSLLFFILKSPAITHITVPAADDGKRDIYLMSSLFSQKCLIQEFKKCITSVINTEVMKENILDLKKEDEKK